MPELTKHFSIELEGYESPSYLICNPGDYFKPSTDGGGAQKKDSIRRRRVSVVTFLNCVRGACGGRLREWSSDFLRPHERAVGKISTFR